MMGSPVLILSRALAGASPQAKWGGGEPCAGCDADHRKPLELDWLLALTQTLMPDGNWAGVASSPVRSVDVVYFGALDGKLCAVGIASGCNCRRRIAWHP